MVTRPKISPEPPPVLPHQDRVNLEIFRAMEILGRKLERVEGERERLARRLALIESAATVDEKTGKLYLPVTVDPKYPLPPAAVRAPGWMVAATTVSSLVAACALGVSLFRVPPPAQQLTQAQVAALDALTTPRLARIDAEKKDWQAPEEIAGHGQPATTTTAAATVPPPLPVWEQEYRDLERRLREEEIAAAQLPAVIEPAAGAEAGKKEETPQPQAAVAAVEQTPPPPPPPEKAPEKPREIAAPAEKPAPPPQAAARKTETAQAPAVPGTVEPDKTLPAKLTQLEKRAFENVGEAQHDLATIYASGELVAQNYRRAVYWFSRAAENGIANADYNLGVMFQQGLGVRQDLSRALGWYQSAAQLGHPEAMYNLGIAYIEGVGAGRDIDRGVTWFKRAANAGVSQAAFNLGVLYESSFIGAADPEKAIEWYQVAAGEGHGEAREAVSRLRTQLGMADEADDHALQLADLDTAAGTETGEGDASPPDEATGFAPGSRGYLIAQIQNLLIQKGLLPGKPTGTLDARTRDSIAAWQKAAGLTADGEPSEELLVKLLRDREKPD